jgi:hypothetical protein
MDQTLVLLNILVKSQQQSEKPLYARSLSRESTRSGNRDNKDNTRPRRTSEGLDDSGSFESNQTVDHSEKSKKAIEEIISEEKDDS